MLVLDASSVIAVLDGSDTHNTLATGLLAHHSVGAFAIHPVTLAETLVGGAKVGRLAELERLISGMGIETVYPDEGEPSLVAELRNSSGLTLPDCYVISLALQLTAPILTFDARLARTAKDRGVAVLAID